VSLKESSPKDIDQLNSRHQRKYYRRKLEGEHYMFLLRTNIWTSRIRWMEEKSHVGRLLGRCNGNQTMNLVTMQRYARLRCYSEASGAFSI
jgi:hypothetical protein